MDSQLRDSNLQSKTSEIQNTATDIAVEFRQLLSYVEARNDNPNFEYNQIKSNFEAIATSLSARLITLQTSAQGTDFLLRDKCQQLSKTLGTIVEDVRHELSATAPSSGSASLASRVQRSTGEAVGLIKSVLAAAQGMATSPSLSSSLSLSPSPPEQQPPQQVLSPTARPLPTPNPSTSSSSQRSYASPTQPFVQQAPSRSTTSSSNTARPLTLTRTISSPHSLRDSARAMSLSSPAATTATSFADKPSSPKPTSTPLSPFSDQLSAGLHRSPSQPLNQSSPAVSPSITLNLPSVPSRSSVGPALSPTVTLPSAPSRSSVGPRRTPAMAVTLLVDGTTSQPFPSLSSNALTILIDKRKDPALTKLVRCVLDSISWITDISLKSKMLAFFVGSAMGKIPAGDFDVCRNCANNYTQLREKYSTEPCPLGEITYGYARHRALLFKYLADSMSLPARIQTHASKLRRPTTGDVVADAKEASTIYSAQISVVEVYIEAEKKWCVVDLVKEVGELYEGDSPQAQEYKKIGIEWEDEQKTEPPKPEPAPVAPDPSPPVSEDIIVHPPIPEEIIVHPPPPSTSPTPPTDAKPNGDAREPLLPTKAPSKPRARSGTGGLPARPQRHSLYSGSVQNSATPGVAPGKAPAKPALQTSGSGRVMRMPIENAEIILNERIGKGTFGDVYRCRISGYTCAVKIVNIKSLSEAALKMMHNEIYFLESLAHENIIGFLGHEELPKREIKIFMEYMPLSLSAIIQKRNSNNHHFNKKDIIKCAKGMAEALSYLHHRKIIHRDIKSSNVLLEIDNTLDRVQEVRLCDFGVSKNTDTAIAITFTGTNLWVAPEVFDVQFGVASSYDEKCDIWSFGMVLVEMVTLNPPYYGINTQEATQNIRNGIPPAIDFNPNLDESVANLILTCLKKVPSERPSADEILSLINQM